MTELPAADSHSRRGKAQNVRDMQHNLMYFSLLLKSVSTGTVYSLYQ
jgi:hypothetical protein